MTAPPEQPPAIPYASPDTAMRWSPLSLMMGSGCCGLLLIILSDAECKFRLIFLDFGVKLPLVTRLTMRMCELVWHHGGWAILLPLMIVWPLALRRIVHAQPTMKRRRQKIRAIWSALIAVCIFSVATVLIEIAPPMLLLVR